MEGTGGHEIVFSKDFDLDYPNLDIILKAFVDVYGHDAHNSETKIKVVTPTKAFYKEIE